jgi:hypothetical protein
MRVSYAIVLVSDMKRSVEFYRDIVGLPLRFETPGWTEFATEGATLALHAAEASTADASQGMLAGCCRPGLSVPDLDQFHQRLLAQACLACRSRRPLSACESRNTAILMASRSPSARSGARLREALHRATSLSLSIGN